MPIIQSVKGTHDLIGEEADAYAYIENVFYAVASTYGYERIDTPILEKTEVFVRSSGDSSDVVRKEMYTFLDKGDRSLTLRPEITAGVARSIVENKLYVTRDLPLKFAYCGPAFRYERPQLGRYRQFRQAGVECIGVDSPRADAECICLAVSVLAMLGFENIKVKVNTLGDRSSRAAYREVLTSYFSAHIDSMCEDCHERLRLNPMRILDCKVPEDRPIVDGAPKSSESLTEEADQRFYETLSILNDMGVDYEIDPTLVRGLDYYGHIVFEVHALSDAGKDYGALAGGGHYDGMLSTLGGPSEYDSGVGFGLGVERLYSMMKDNGLLNDVAHKLDIYLMPIGESVLDECYELLENIRLIGYSAIMPFKTAKLGSMFKKAERSGAKFALIIGDEELEKGVAQLKNLATKEQKEVHLATLDEELDAAFAEIEEHEEGCDCPQCQEKNEQKAE